MAHLDFDFRHARLGYAPGTEFEKVGAQKRFREEVRHVALSADEFDRDHAAFDVVTVLEESNVEVLVFPRSFRIVRSEDASQNVTVEWRRRNKDGVRPMVSRRFLAPGHHIESGNARNNKAALKQQRSQPNAFVRAGSHSNEFRFMSTCCSQGLQLGPPRNEVTEVEVASARNRTTVFLIRRCTAAVGFKLTSGSGCILHNGTSTISPSTKL